MTLILRGTDNSVSAPAVQGGTAGTTTGVYYPTSNTLAIAANGVLSLTADSANRVLVGPSGAPVWDERLGSRIDATGAGQVGLGVYSASASYTTSLLRVQAENPTGAAWNILDGRGTGGGIKILIDGNGLINLYSGQIQFPATQNPSSNANTLDDYEEGTWTPTFVSTGASITYLAQYGTYIKIGRLVYAQFYLNATMTGTTSNSIYLGNLPFSPSSASAYDQSGVAAWCTSTVGVIQPLTSYNDTNALLWKTGGGASASAATAANLSGCYFVGTAVYRSNN